MATNNNNIARWSSNTNKLGIILTSGRSRWQGCGTNERFPLVVRLKVSSLDGRKKLHATRGSRSFIVTLDRITIVFARDDSSKHAVRPVYSLVTSFSSEPWKKLEMMEKIENVW